MGSTYSVVVYGGGAEAMESAIDATFDEIERLEALLSNYRPESEWSMVNRCASERPVKVSAELFRLVSECLEYSRQSDGAFDISVSPLVKTWGFNTHAAHLPDSADTGSARLRVGYEYIELDPAAQTIYFRRPGMEIDPGGIGKGYTADRMAAILRERGFTTALIAASFSTIYGMGAPPAEPRGWLVKVRHPARPTKPVAEVYLRDMSLSTSGAGERSLKAGGRVYSHIMNPRTGEPAGETLVAVLASRNIDTEAWTKSCIVNGPAWIASHPVPGRRVFYCEDHSSAGVWLE